MISPLVEYMTFVITLLQYLILEEERRNKWRR
jgi:hypothetical protein